MSTLDPLVAHLRRVGHELGTRTCVRDRGAALDTIVSTALVLVPNADAAGLTLVDCYLPTANAAPASVVALDALQGGCGEGPAATALTDPPADGTVLAEDFAGPDGDRWPRFAPHVLEAGYRSMISVLLEVEGAPRGTVNLYGVAPHAFDARARRVAGLFAITASMVLLGVEQVALLERAVASRDVIGRAKGVLMERFWLDEDAAYAKLVDASQHTNVKLVDVARWLDREFRAGGGRHAAFVDEPCL
ncbi:MAG TPA: GAF and ANTAR domain-containing protein [Actinomycetospora sp.]|uniref:GAF and ANTAR domain-containing protein n=1 Tax=Actinomycetospora sp. TaxID=1872135 RepID=UPI002F3ED2E3